MERFSWGFFQTSYDDEEDETRLEASIGCLHESVLQGDPTGREMRPRGH